MSDTLSGRDHRRVTDLAGPDVDRAGLSWSEARARLARDGPNRLPTPPGVPLWKRLGAQFVHFFAVMLWVAAALAWLAGLPQLAVAIVVVVVVNGVFAFAQEHKAERAAEQLRELLPRRVTVVRDGNPADVDADELVMGDLVVLGAGDRVSADLQLLEAHGLGIDTSTLTGESVPEIVEPPAPAFAGTFVVEGEGLGLVTATGDATRLAGIARLTRSGRRPPSPLAVELHRVVRTVAVVAVGVGVGFFTIALLVGTPASDGFLFAVGVTVALVPEGLLPTVTLSLAIGAQRMSSRHALVRRLEAVETLGSTTFICTDKTGTLTRNEMAVVAVWTPAGEASVQGEGYAPTATVDVAPDALGAVERLAAAARQCSDGRVVESPRGWVARGDPMEAAIDALATRLDLGAAPISTGRRFPFDPRRRRMSVIADGRLVVKGAPDATLPRCTTGTHGAHEALERLAARGLRVLAIAVRDAGRVPVHVGADEAEQDLELLGLLALEDPPRAGIAASLAACRKAGMKVAMVTGDHPATAAAIAREVGLAGPDAMVLEGHALPDDDSVLGALVDRDGVVVSRVTPEAKLRIARALRARGHVIAMTGDGVNDGPALHEADIGVAMGRSGTDVAREAADLVLLDDDFTTIVVAVEQGRATYTNIRRFLTYHLTDNVAELTPFAVWALSGGRFPLALGVLQILALDIGTDMLPALALGAEPPASHVLDRPPIVRHLVDRRLLVRVFGVLGPAEAVVEMAAFVATFLAVGWRPGETFPTGADLMAAASGAAFMAVVVGQCANAFACRSSTRWVGQMPLASNRLLVWAVAAELVALALFLGFEPVADVLDQAVPSLAGAAVALLAAPAVIAADAAHKWYRARHRAA